MKILVVIPNYGMSREVLEERRKMFKSMTSMNTEFEVTCIDWGPETIEGDYDEVLAGPAIIEKIKDADKKYDAVIIYCFSDPAVEAARELLDIPVIGPGEVSLHLASMLGNKFSIITVLEELIPHEYEMVKKYGLTDKLASIRSINIPVSDLRKNLDETARKVIEVAKKAIEEDGAQVIVLSCLGFAGIAQKVQEEVGVPVIDPAAAAIKMAELMIDMHIMHSRKRYPKPRTKVRIPPK